MQNSISYLLRYGILPLLLLIIFSIGPINLTVSGQTGPAIPGDQLKNQSINSVDTNSVIARLQIALAIYESFPDSAKNIATEAFRHSAQLGFQLGMARSCIILGRISQNDGQFDSATYLFTKGLISAKKANLTTASFYINIANNYFFRGAYQQAMENYLSALQSSPRKNTSGDSCQVYLNIALIWTRLGAFEQANHYLDIVQPIAYRTRDTAMQVSLLTSRADILMAENKNPEAIKLFRKSLRLATATNLPGPALEILNELTHAYLSLEQADNAMMSTQEAMEILKMYPGAYNFHRYHTQHHLGLIYRIMGNHAYAEQLLSHTYATAAQIGLKDLLLHMEQDLAAVYAHNGKHALAYEHILHYAQLKDSILEKERKNMLSLWQENIVAGKDNALLTQKFRLVEQQKRLQTKNVWIGGALLFTAVVSLLFLNIVRGYRRKQKLQEEQVVQLKQKQEIKQLKARVRGEEEERNRLALELHDGIASQLWAIRLNVESLQQQSANNNLLPQHIQMIYQQLDDTTQEVRKTAHNLMPDLLLKYGLASALSSLCEKINSSTPLEVNFMEFGVIPKMDEEIELSLYRMIQELIQNVLKHALGATQLLVQVSCNNSLLNITIEDNGSGFNVQKLEDKGFGLRNIERRVNILKGHFDLKSSEGKSTTAYLEFDIHNLL